MLQDRQHVGQRQGRTAMEDLEAELVRRRLDGTVERQRQPVAGAGPLQQQDVLDRHAGIEALAVA
ncbi:MAG TPA: hypothetical protein PKA64_26280, partial [Myxococcota bacterium]|nr:hypothetical protein [Myxococcota bacterium]